MRSILWFLAPIGLFGCGDGGELVVTPNPLAFGEVDFNLPMPDEGYHITEIFLQNDTKNELNITIQQLDDDHLLLGAPLISESPPSLGPLAPGSFQTVTLAIWNYSIEGGERDSLVTGTLSLHANELKNPATLDWSFTPVRIWDEDTGR